MEHDVGIKWTGMRTDQNVSGTFGNGPQLSEIFVGKDRINRAMASLGGTEKKEAVGKISEMPQGWGMSRCLET
jgi:hypothetical protein